MNLSLFRCFFIYILSVCTLWPLYLALAYNVTRILQFTLSQKTRVSPSLSVYKLSLSSCIRTSSVSDIGLFLHFPTSLRCVFYDTSTSSTCTWRHRSNFQAIALPVCSCTYPIISVFGEILLQYRYQILLTKRCRKFVKKVYITCLL